MFRGLDLNHFSSILNEKSRATKIAVEFQFGGYTLQTVFIMGRVRQVGIAIKENRYSVVNSALETKRPLKCKESMEP